MERSDRVPPLASVKLPSPAQEAGNFDFRLQFHASRVPKPGWDKLVVSLISIETGKTTTKTPRGLVRNGSCQWPDPIIESTTITQDPESKDYNKKLYKLMVQMGSLRVGILGEATINLTDYINSDSPDTISLPLKKCTTGTVLHVKIECLTSKAGPKELEGTKINSSDEEFLRSASDSDKESYSSEDMTVGSVTSFASQSTNGDSNLLNSQRLSKDGPLFITTSRQDSFDSSYGTTSNREVQKEALSQDYQTSNAVLPRRFGSIPMEDMTFSQESIKSPYASNHNGGTSITKGWQDAYSWQSECANPNTYFSPSSQNDSRFISNLPQKLDAAEATIKELREETLTWERHSHKLNVEVETLKQQLATELKNGAELRVRISSLKSENERLRSELGQRRAPGVAFSRREDVDSFFRLELDKNKLLVTALQEENTYEKEMSANLRIQLQKTQDSNNELVSVVTELEVALELRNKEITRLDDLNRELNEQLNKIQELNAELPSRVHESDVIASAGTEMEKKIVKPGLQMNWPVQNEAKDELCEVLDMLEKEMKAQNVDCKELTSEKIVLLHELCKANRLPDANAKLIAVLEASFQGILKSEVSGKQLSSNKFTNKQDFINDLKVQVREREHWNYLSEHQCLEGAAGSDYSLFKSNELIHNNSDIDIDDKDMITVGNLEMIEVAAAHEFGDHLIEMNSMQTLYLEADHARLKEKSKEFFQSMEILVEALKKHKDNTDPSLHCPHKEVSKISNQQDGYSAELSEMYENVKSCKVFEKQLPSEVLECCFDIEKLVQELAEYTACEKKLHMQLVEARTEIVTLDTELQASIKQKKQYESCLNELELQVPVLLEEIKLLQALKVDYQSSKSQVEMEKIELQEKLDKASDESRAATDKLNELVGKIAALTTTNETLERRALALQSEKEELKTEVMNFEKENIQLLERIIVFEAEFKRMHEERELKIDLKTLGLLEPTGNWQLNESFQDMVTSDWKVEELELEQAFPLEEAKHHAVPRQGLYDELHHYEDEKTPTKFIRDLHEQLLEAVTKCSLLKEKGCSLEVEIAEVQRERDLQEQSLQAEIASLCRMKDGFEQRANKAEERMHQMQKENAAAVLLLQSELQELTNKLTSMSNVEQKLAEALGEATELRTTENVELQVNVKNLQIKLTKTEEQLCAVQKKVRNDEAERQEESKRLLTNSSEKLQESFLLSQPKCEKQLLINEQILCSQSPEVVELKQELKNIKNIVDQLNHEMNDANVSLKAAMTECANLQQEKMDAVEKLDEMMMEMSELKQQKTVLEETLSFYKQLMKKAQEAVKTEEEEQRNEILRLKSHVNEFQRLLMDRDEEKLEFQTRLESLEAKLLLKTEALSRTEKQLKEIETAGSGLRSVDRINSRGRPSFSLRESKEVLELRHNLKLLEEYMKSKEDELNSHNIAFMERESDLCDRIEQLELSNKQLAAGLIDPGVDQLKKELLRLQIQNSSLARKEQELLQSTRMQEVLQEEVLRLQEENELLEARLAKFMETAKNPFLLEKIMNLETELAEALEANNMYRLQLKGVLDKQQNVNMASLKDLDELEQIRKDLSQYKKRAAELEDALDDMNERYTLVSLRLAETEIKRGELLITLRNLRNAKIT